ncbi:Na+/H+ antiporter [Amycolatopsis sp. WAC 01416]|uniref:Na+/H+ antiporter n=1 Tax=Amycolatopsis sp. WAC 01416 TaxID=2203196 RepID=UPI000F77FA26|nr:Na+/H+ antiporter [Amycolatopsis sp. WAC 01416]RSN21523.1 Na+/H+ antiporter [Amycolatopsis sp. WAC 01416]
MLGAIGFVLVMLGVIVVVSAISHRIGLPDPVLLTVVGLVYALLPGPNLHLEPEFVLDVILPPLLYNAALGSSLLAIRSRLRSVVSLSVLLVLATAFAVGGLLTWLVPAIPLAAAIALGAAVAPPDPVAALAVGRRVGLPAKLSTLIEGEGLLNDATALTVYKMALAVAVGGSFSFGLATGEFALATIGGLLVGVVVAFLVRLSRRVLADPLSANAVSLATPFTAYVLGETIHGSGVLAVVVAGLIVGHQTPRLQTGASRLQTGAVWSLVNYLLEGFVFLLIGQQLPAVIAGLGGYPAGSVVLTAVVTVGAVLLVRPLWLVLTQLFPRRLHARLGSADETGEAAERALTGKEIAGLSWAGTRGVITLAAAFAIPVVTADGSPFPARDLLLFSAFLVVLVTLVGQGVTFGPLLKRLGLRADVQDQARLRNQARSAAVDAALARLDQLVEEDDVPDEAVAALRKNLQSRQRRYRARLAYLEDNPLTPRAPGYEAAVRARHSIIEAQREELLRWRDAGRLPDASLRILQTELDHEENALMPSSGKS